MASREVSTDRWAVRGWGLVLLLSLTHLSAFTDRFMTSLLVTPLKHDLRLSDTQLGLLEGTAFAAVYVLASPGMGWLADVWGRGRMILAGIVTWSCAAGACGLTHGFGPFLVARMTMGLGQAALAPAALGLLAADVNDRALGRGISIFTAGSTLGKGVALLAGGAVLALLKAHGGLRLPWSAVPLASWRSVFILTALPNLLLILAWAGRRDRRGVAQAVRATPGARFSEALAWVRAHPAAFSAHSVAALTPLLLVQALAAWAPTLFVRSFGLSLPQSGLLVGGLVLIAAPLGHLAGGVLVDRLRRAEGAPGYVIAIGLVLSLPAASAFCLTSTLWVCAAAYGVLTLTLGMCAPAGLAGLQAISPDRLRSGINGMYFSAVGVVGLGVAPPLVGLLSDRAFTGGRALAYALWTVLCLPGAVGAAVAWISRRPWLMARRETMRYEAPSGSPFGVFSLGGELT